MIRRRESFFVRLGLCLLSSLPACGGKLKTQQQSAEVSKVPQTTTASSNASGPGVTFPPSVPWPGGGNTSGGNTGVGSVPPPGTLRLVDAAAAAFSPQVLPADITRTLTLQADGGPVVLGNPVLTGSSVFSIVGTDCPNPLPPSTPCHLGVRYLPPDHGSFTADLGIPYGNGPAGASPLVIHLSGSALRPAQFVVNTSLLDFGKQSQGINAGPLKAIITNTGDVPAVLAVTGSTASFTWAGACSPLAPGQSCEFAVTYHANTLGSQSTVFGLNYVGTGSPVSITASGTALQPAWLVVNTNLLDFGKQSYGIDAGPLKAIVTNVGEVPAAVAVMGSTASFSWSGNCSALAPGQSCEFAVTYHANTPQGPGPQSTVFGLNYVGTGSPVSITARGLSAHRLLLTGPASYSTHLIGRSWTEGILPFNFGISSWPDNGIRVAGGDVNGDGMGDVIAGLASNGSALVVYDGRTGGVLTTFNPYSDYAVPFPGGINVAFCPGTRLLITAPGPTSPDAPLTLVRKWAWAGVGSAVQLVGSFDPYPGGNYGVSVACGDINGNGREAIVVSSQAYSSSVKEFDVYTDQPLRPEFFPYGSPGNPWLGGLEVAVERIGCGPGKKQIITGASAGGGPHLQVLDETGQAWWSFNAFDPAFTGGIHVAGGDVNGDGCGDVLVGAGAGGGPHVKVFSGTSAAEIFSEHVYACSPGACFTGGVNVGYTF